MNISRSWSMPNKKTFSIIPIKKLIEKYNHGVSADPFAKNSTIATHRNDLDPEFKTHFNMDALEFLKMFKKDSLDVVFFDPPYSPRQVSESYKKLGKAVNMQTTQSSYWGNLKKEISRIIKPGGVSITCGWNSNGVGKVNGFKIIEILIVAHGGWHNDTIVTVERKIKRD